MAYSILSDEQYANELNKARRDLGLQPLERKSKKCLSCSKRFTAIGRGNFMCARCRRFKVDYDR